jgi:NAD(P)-dependent dehydrogenase (short-subunit alcohol dehydrogenase family)
MEGFENKVAIITGAGGGLGKALCRQLATCGARVVGVGRTAARLDEALGLIHAAGGDGRMVVGDITDAATATRTVATAAEVFGGVDILINNASVGYSYEHVRPGSMGALGAQSPELWREVIGINLNGAAIMTQAALPTLLKRGEGANIVFVASNMGLGGYTAGHAYSAAKAGMINLVQSLAVTHGPVGLRTNCVAPGPIDTPMIADLLATGVWNRTPRGSRSCPSVAPRNRTRSRTPCFFWHPRWPLTSMAPPLLSMVAQRQRYFSRASTLTSGQDQNDLREPQQAKKPPKPHYGGFRKYSCSASEVACAPARASGRFDLARTGSFPLRL